MCSRSVSLLWYLDVSEVSLAGAWIPFQDPDGEENKVLIIMKERISSENLYREANANEYEMKESNMRRFIRESFYDVEVALNTWLSWVQWRHGMLCLHAKIAF